LKKTDAIEKKIFSLDDLRRHAGSLKWFGKKIVFTNGVFDLLHQGHVYSLQQAAQAGDFLIVGLNSDASVKRLKGESRPLNNQGSRALLLASLLIVDAVIIFEENTPLELIKAIMPDILVKGGDYTTEQIAGAKEVIANGGQVIINPILEGFSTSSLVDKIKA
jgi:D-glycero-beta-D-manno-heptose 1-phosphate adenylyltransferase